jgi:predicted proteasome-type protease
MPWHRVSIAEELSAEAFLNEVSKAIQRTDSAQSLLDEAQVYREANVIGDAHTFYVSPEASILAKEALRDFSAVACSDPNLAGLRKALPSLKRAGQKSPENA